jgi:pyridoxine 5-phosphate synthase
MTRLEDSLFLGIDLGLEVHAGHGLTYQNVQRMAELGPFGEFNIGHTIVARSVLVGMREAVREMKALLTK